AKQHARCAGLTGIVRGKLVLGVDRCAHSLDDAREFSEQPVAPGVDHPAAMAGDEARHGVAVLLQGGKRTFLVGLHQARIALHVGGKDGGELALRHGHCRRPQLRAPNLGMHGPESYPAFLRFMKAWKAARASAERSRWPKWRTSSWMRATSASRGPRISS